MLCFEVGGVRVPSLFPVWLPSSSFFFLYWSLRHRFFLSLFLATLLPPSFVIVFVFRQTHTRIIVFYSFNIPDTMPSFTLKYLVILGSSHHQHNTSHHNTNQPFAWIRIP